MKIEIEWNCSYLATIRIDGRELTVDMKPGVTTLGGLKKGENGSKFGAIVGGELYSKIADLMQAEATMHELQPDAQTWDKLDDDVAEQVCEHATGF